MNRCFSYLLAFIACSGFACGDEAGVAAILKKWNEDQKEWKAAYEFATPEQRNDLLKTQPNPDAIAKPLWVELKPIINTPEALPGVVWVLSNVPSMIKSLDEAERQTVTPLILTSIENNMIKLPGVGQLAYSLGMSSDIRCRKILENIRKHNPSSRDQGLAALALAMSMKEKQGMVKDDPRTLSVMLVYLREAINKCFDEPFGDGRVNNYCTELLYELKNLCIGKKAPEIELEAYNGETVKIPSGRPTMIAFCVTDDQTSMSLVADADVLKKKYPDLDFYAVCPMNKEKADKDLPLFQLSNPEIVLLDENAGIFKAFRVDVVPFVYFIDQSGIVKMRGTPDFGFSMMLDKVMKEVRGEKSAPQASPSEAPKAADNAATPSAAPTPAAPSRPSASPAPKPPVSGGDDLLSAPKLRPMPE